MIHVVTGAPRSGTSMLMRCLQFAGIEPVVDSGRESRMQGRNKPEYAVNPYGFFEPDEREVLRVGYLASLPDGVAIKVQIPTLCTLPARPVTVYWMHREPAEVRASTERTFPDIDFTAVYKRWPDSLVEQERVTRGILDDRKSIRVIDVDYAKVIASPESALWFLPPSSAYAVDPLLYRNKAA